MGKGTENFWGMQKKFLDGDIYFSFFRQIVKGQQVTDFYKLLIK